MYYRDINGFKNSFQQLIRLQNNSFQEALTQRVYQEILKELVCSKGTQNSMAFITSFLQISPLFPLALAYVLILKCVDYVVALYMLLLIINFMSAALWLFKQNLAGIVLSVLSCSRQWATPRPLLYLWWKQRGGWCLSCSNRTLDWGHRAHQWDEAHNRLLF